MKLFGGFLGQNWERIGEQVWVFWGHFGRPSVRQNLWMWMTYIRDRIGGGDPPKGGGDFGRSVTTFSAPKAPKNGNF